MATIKQIASSVGNVLEKGLNDNPEVAIKLIERMPTDVRKKVLGSFCPLCYNRIYGRCDCQELSK
jgi:hypothetical protein